MATSTIASRARSATLVILLVVALGLCARSVSTNGLHFYPDDPIAREPESQDASQAKPYEIGSLYEMIAQPVRHRGLQADRHAGEESQHD